MVSVLFRSFWCKLWRKHHWAWTVKPNQLLLIYRYFRRADGLRADVSALAKGGHGLLGPNCLSGSDLVWCICGRYFAQLPLS